MAWTNMLGYKGSRRGTKLGWITLLAAVGVLAALGQTTQAATVYWDPGITGGTTGGGTGSWDLALGNWFTPGTGDQPWNNAGLPYDDAVFQNSGGTVDVGDYVWANSLTFNSNGYTIASSGGIPLTLDSTATSGTSTVTVTNSADTATISAEIDGGTGLAKAGLGTLVITNSNNFFSGGIYLNAGTLQFANLSTLNSNLITFNGGTLQWATGNTDDVSGLINIGSAGQTAILDTHNSNVTFLSSIGGAGGITKTGAGTLTLGADNSFSGATTINQGKVVLDSVWALEYSTVTSNVSNGLSFAAGIGSFGIGGLSGSNNLSLIDVGSQPVSLDIGGNNQSTTYSGSLSGGTVTMTQGTGVLTLSGSSNSAFAVSSGALDVAGFSAHVGPLVLSGGSLTGSGGTLSAPSIELDSGTVSANLAGPSNITKTTGGTVYITAANTFGGTTTINGGTVRLADPNALQNSTVAVNTTDGTGLYFNSQGDTSAYTLGGLSGTGLIVLNDTNNHQLNLSVGNNNANTTFSGQLVGGPWYYNGILTKIGTGTLTMAASAKNTYGGGTVINGGVLQMGTGLNNIMPFDAGWAGSNWDGDVTIGGSGTFDLNGTTQKIGSLNGSGLVTDTAGGGTLQVYTATGPGPTTANFSGVISGSGLNVEVNTYVYYGGTQVFSGSSPNTYSGTTTLSYGNLALSKSPGVAAVSGTVNLITTPGPSTILYTTQNNQFASGAVMNIVEGGNGGQAAFELDGTTQTLDSINDPTGRGLISNSQYGPANSGNGTLVLNGNESYTFGGNLQDGSGGTLSFTKAGTGALVFLGSSNTYTGTTTVSSGTLQVGDFANPNTGSLASNTVVIAPSATLALVNLGDASVYAPTGGIVDNGDLVVHAGEAGWWWYRWSLTAAISGTGNLTMSGTDTVHLNGPNTFSGQTILNGGLLNVHDPLGLQNSTVVMDVTDGMAMADGSTDFTIGGLTGSANLSVENGNGGSVNLNIGNNNQSTTFSGNLTHGNPWFGTITKIGTGTLTLAGSGTNSYAGGTFVNSGVLKMGAASSGLMPNGGGWAGSLTVGASGAFDLNGTSQQVGSLIGSGLVTDTAGGGTLVASPYGGATSDQVNPTYSGVISGGMNMEYGAPLQGGGVQTLAGTTANTYTGTTTVDSGATLILSNTGAVAVPGDITIGTGNHMYAFVVTTEPGQFPTTAKVNFGPGGWGSGSDWQGFSLMGNSATLGGITDAGGWSGGGYDGGGVLTNGSIGAAAASPATLTLDLSTTNNQVLGGVSDDMGVLGGPGGSAPLSIVVAGHGMVQFAGTGVNYTGSTTVSGGTLQLLDTNAFASSGVSVANDTTLQLSLSAVGGQSIGDGGAVKITGGGHLVLTGVNSVSNPGMSAFDANQINASFTGDVVISNARLNLDNASGDLGGITSITVNAGAQMGSWSGATTDVPLNIAGQGWYENWGGSTVSLGALRLEGDTWAGPITLTADARIASGFGGGFITGNISGAHELEIGGDGTGDQYTIALTPAGANTFASLRVSADAIVLAGNANALGTGGPLTMNGGTLQTNGFDFAFARLDDTGAGGQIQNTAAGDSTITVGSDNASTTYFGTLADGGGGGTLGLTKTGAGILTLAADSTHSGLTTINQGAVQLGSANAVQNSTVVVNVDNGVTFAGGIGLFYAGGLSGSNQVTLTDAGSSGVIFAVGNNGTNTTFSGKITGAGSLAKVGSGTLTITNSHNNYAGGTLLASGVVNFAPNSLPGAIDFSYSDGTATLQWAAGNTQDVSGQIAYNNSTGAIILDTNGNDVLATGNLSGVGGLTKTGEGKMTFSGTNTYQGDTTVSGGTAEFTSSTALAGSGSLNVSGDGYVMLDGALGAAEAPSLARLAASSSLTGEAPGLATLIAELKAKSGVAALSGGIDSATPTLGVVASVPAVGGAGVALGAGSGSASAVPEPGTLALLLAGVFCGLGVWWKRRK